MDLFSASYTLSQEDICLSMVSLLFSELFAIFEVLNHHGDVHSARSGAR
jgi:hypothetical protein